jgi:hypothetical protein
MQPLIDLGFEPMHFDKTKPSALQGRRFGETAEQSHRVEVRRGSANGHFYKTNLQKG